MAALIYLYAEINFFGKQFTIWIWVSLWIRRKHLNEHTHTETQFKVENQVESCFISLLRFVEKI